MTGDGLAVGPGRRRFWLRWPQRAMLWGQRVGFGRWLLTGLMIAAIVAGILTALVLTESGWLNISDESIFRLLVLDAVLLLGIGGAVTWVLVRLWAARRAGAAGARIHVRLVSLFALLAVVPAITVAVLAAAFFSFEVRAWFNERVQTAVSESVMVAEAYLEEHKQVIAADAMGMAKDIELEWSRIIANRLFGAQAINSQALVRSLSEAIVFDSSGTTVARTTLAFALELDRPPAWAMEQAEAGGVVILTTESEDRVRALVRLDTVPSSFLYVGRFVDAQVLGHMQRTQSAATEYKHLRERRAFLQGAMTAIFMLVTMLLLLTAVGLGLLVANRLVRPIGRLVEAAERVRAGDLSVRLEVDNRSDELGTLTRSFNRMTEQLEEQRGELIEANRQLDQRRKFTEAVLAGVSAGVVGLDSEGTVNLPNRSALRLLGAAHDRLVGMPLAVAVPEMATLVSKVRKTGAHSMEVQVSSHDVPRTLNVSAIAERGESGQVVGFVVTFDDVTELLAAQRKAAWGDIARRIAHEIKNPLTPIQLSAERLKRKYLPEIRSDPETFRQCTDTIARQVSDIGRMVDEFSSFARMPRATIRDEDLGAICREAVMLHRSAHTGVRYDLDMPDTPPRWRCDRRLVSQALTNLLKNALEALQARPGGLAGGWIGVTLTVTNTIPAITVADNGCGLPEQNRERLTEPYVTTRSGGTGLGLAIVRKIMDDHRGHITILPRAGGGAAVTLTFGPTVPLSLDRPSRLATTDRDVRPGQGDFPDPVARHRRRA